MLRTAWINSSVSSYNFISCLVFLIPLLLTFSLLFVTAEKAPPPVKGCQKWDACSQLCDDQPGANVSCSCIDGFRLGNDSRSCASIDPKILVAYALTSSIRVLDTSRNRTHSLHEGRGHTVGVTVDVRNGYVIWTDVVLGDESVRRAKINGDGSVETIIDTGLVIPEGIAFDWVTGNIYITDSNRSHIVVCNGEGRICTVLLRQLMMDKPREISLHPGEGVMFWTDYGDKSAIWRASMSGAFPTPIVTDDIKWPNSLAVDLGRERLYWSDAYHDKMETSTLTGQDRRMVAMDKIKHPFSLKVFGDLLVWTDWELKSIQSCTKFSCTSDIQTLVSTPVTPNGVAIFHPAAQPLGRANPCKSQCSHLCVLNGKLGYACRCPVGYLLDTTLKNCIDDEIQPKILVGHDNFLKIVRFNGIGRDIDVVEETRLSDLKSIGAITYNPVNNTVFISDLMWKAIYEYSIPQKTLQLLTNRHLDSIKSMALDPVGENLYWVDSSRRKIEVMSCRTGAKALIAMEADYPQSIIVVPEERYLFVALTGRRGGRILRMHMNGYHLRTLVRTNRGEPISLTYNSEMRRVFWVDSRSSGDSIQHVTVDGQSQSIAERSGSPYGLMSFGNRIYWTDRFTQQLHTLALYGMGQKESPLFVGHMEDRQNSGIIESYIKGNFLAKLGVVYQNRILYENLTRNHECSTSRANRKCSHICLFSADQDIGTCVCPEGMLLNSDERTCSWPTTCLKSQFQCNDQKCIDGNWRCDGSPDCADGEDERNCTQIAGTCSGETDFMCSSDRSCIHSKWKCDGEKDCPNGEDEYNCVSHTCAPGSEFQCNNGRCIPIAWTCDHQPECPNGEDEFNCSTTCPIGTFQCKANMECISVDWVCDGEKDCSDGSDEHRHCVVACSSNSFRCLDHHCIPVVLTCNGISDCADNSDELDCTPDRITTLSPPSTFEVFERGPLDEDNVPLVESPETKPSNGSYGRILSIGGSDRGLFEVCPSTHYSCKTGECLHFDRVCDTYTDCSDGSDEGAGCQSACKDSSECPHKCHRTPEGSKCDCHSGYEQDKKNKRGCVDINECTAGRPCEHMCVNTRGSFKCLCHDEYALRSDQRRCKPKTKSIKPHFIHPSDRVDPSVGEVSAIDTGFRSGFSTGWWVFGIFLIVLLVGGVVTYVFHRKRLHPKVLFERYAHQIPVKFKIRRSDDINRNSLDDETYQDFSDGPRSSCDNADLLSNMVVH